MLVVTALFVGAGTGLGGVIFVWLLAAVSDVAATVRAQIGDVAGLFITMGIGGLAVGFLAEKVAVEVRGGGVPEVMEAIALRGGRIRRRVAFLKTIASSITIGLGGSAGREGPIVQIGAALGSAIGQFFRFSTERVRMLVACGAAAGISVTFNAPIAGVIFALEVILERFTSRYFGVVVISAVSAGIVGRIYLTDEPAFAVPAYQLNHLGELPIYVFLGLLAAIVAVLFIRALYFLSDLFERWSASLAYKAAAGMLLTALVALPLPERQILGSGLDFIGQTIASDFALSLQLMASLFILKLLATSLTIGSGNSGGVFAPSLFIGAALGGLVGSVAHLLWPTVAVNPGAYAIVGMAAVFAGAARAPITAVLIVFEMSGDYKLILPLMMATVLSTLLADYLFAESIYSLKLRLKGINLVRGRDEDVMRHLLVREAMTRDPYVVETDMPLYKLGQLFERTHAHSFPVVDGEHRLVGMVSINDYDRALEEGVNPEAAVSAVATMGQLLLAYDDEPLSVALQRIGVRDVNKLPVVSREEPDRIVGVIRRRDISKAYNIALSRRRQERGVGGPLLLPEDEGMEFLEVEIPAGSPAAEQSLASLGSVLPHNCVVVSIRRDGALLIPHGDTVLRPGDRVTVFVGFADEEELRQCLLGRPQAKDQARFE